MTVLTRLKLALALIGVVLFAAGIRFDDPRLRMGAIGFVAAAWLLRFAKEREEREAPDEGGGPPE